ncbi:MAG: magnesium transporter [Bacteroidetes bacterium]|nr:magnesium transporter [Bacteroidota bacterium]
MQFQLTPEYLELLRKAIGTNDLKFIMEQLKELHPPDIAEIFNELNLEESKYLYKQLDENEAGKVLVEMEDDKREKFLASLTSREIAEHIDNMASDDAADVIAELPDSVQDEVLSHLEDHEQASDIVDLMNYDENTAGGLMATELVRVHVNDSVRLCVRELRKQAEEVKNIYTIYVVDDSNKLLGLLSLKSLLTTSLSAKVKDVYNPDIISVKTNTPAEEAAKIMEKYDLVVLPVIDSLGKLVGRITIDDIVDVIREEETEDVQKMGGMEALDEPYMSIPFLGMIKKRVGWLTLLFIGESFTATAMGFFEGEIKKAAVLATFIPLIISSGGNTGSQVSTLIIRALSLGEITISEWLNIVQKEIKVGLALGFALGVLGFLRVAIWSSFTDIYGPHWKLIGVCIGVALMGVVLWGNLMGSLFPIILKRLGLDPAVSSAPFVATMVDVTGLIIYFTVASIMLSGIIL